MATCVGLIVVLTVFACCGINPNIANPSAQISLLDPTQPQRVYRNESLAFNCITDGEIIRLSFYPTFSDENQPFNIFSTDRRPNCNSVSSSSYVCTLFDGPESFTFVGTLIMVIPSDAELGNYTVYCNTSRFSALTDFGMASTNFTVISETIERYDVDESVQNIITSPDPSSTDDKPDPVRPDVTSIVLYVMIGIGALLLIVVVLEAIYIVYLRKKLHEKNSSSGSKEMIEKT